MAITEDRNIGSYIGVPIKMANGDVFGTLCAVDSERREFTIEELDLLQILAKTIAYGMELDLSLVRERELSRELSRSISRLAHDGKAINQVHAAIMPGEQETFEEYEVAGSYIPAGEVGGDFYDWATAIDDSLTVVVADVMGKGVAAATLMLAVSSATRALTPLLGARPGELLTQTNAALFPMFDRTHSFATAFAARLDKDGGVVYADAGHGLALVRLASGTVKELGPVALPLGINKQTEYAAATSRLEPGESMIVMTDGAVLDATEDWLLSISAQDSLLGCVTDWSSARSIRDSVVNVIQASAAADRSGDDVTVLVVTRRSPVPDVCPGHSVELLFEPAIASFAEGEAELGRLLQAAGVQEEEVEAIVTAAHEVLVNAVEHAKASGTISLKATLSDSAVELVIQDNGLPFDDMWPDSNAAVPGRERGYGLLLTQAILDHVAYNRAGELNQWVLIKHHTTLEDE